MGSLCVFALGDAGSLPAEYIDTRSPNPRQKIQTGLHYYDSCLISPADSAMTYSNWFRSVPTSRRDMRKACAPGQRNGVNSLRKVSERQVGIWWDMGMWVAVACGMRHHQSWKPSVGQHIHSRAKSPVEHQVTRSRWIPTTYLAHWLFLFSTFCTSFWALLLPLCDKWLKLLMVFFTFFVTSFLSVVFSKSCALWFKIATPIYLSMLMSGAGKVFGLTNINICIHSSHSSF